MLTLQQKLAISYLPGISAQGARGVVESGVGFDELVTAPAAKLARLGMRRAAVEAVTAPGPYLERAEIQMARAAELGASIIDFWDSRYPALLRETYAPPMILYALGDAALHEPAVAVVGTRRATLYGRISAENYAARFATAGVTVISGLARGIDTFAHSAALRAGGQTVAVVASGLDRIQPAYAFDLVERIAARGAVVTEYPFGVKALRPYFPARNRIISGMASGVVVVESDERGGAMITAGFALDQNRDVFALPGPVGAEKSRGTNLLIRTDRARLTQEPDDVLVSLGFQVPPPAGLAAMAATADALTAFEQVLLDALSGVPVHIDALCEATGIAPGDALVHLLALEFKGLVRQVVGKMFLRL